MADIALFDMPSFLSLSKNSDWKNRFLLRGKVLLDFYLDNDLLREKFIESIFPVSEATIVNLSYTTEMGLALFKEGAIDRWYDAHDRGRPIEDTRILERGLKKVKELGPDHFLDDEWIQQWATPE